MEIRKGRGAFTLIELLVVIAIIGILIAMLLPAVQKVRESASRAICQNNLKQWGLAMHAHHDAYRKFPAFSRSTPARQAWPPYVMPYLEQGNLVAKYDINLGWSSGPNFDVTRTPLPVFYCPSDRPGAMFDDEGAYISARGNYVVCYGNILFGGSTVGEGRGVFGCTSIENHLNNLYTPYQTRLSKIVDGTSNTILMSEILVAKLNNNQNTASGTGNWRNGDWRGHVWHDVMMSSQSQCPGIFMTINGPNSSVPDNGLCGTVPNNDPLMPCTNGAATARVNTARSRHAGGVNTAFADGSIRFMTNSINLPAWNALGTLDGGEPISEVE